MNKANELNRFCRKPGPTGMVVIPDREAEYVYIETQAQIDKEAEGITDGAQTYSLQFDSITDFGRQATSLDSCHDFKRKEMVLRNLS